MPPRPSSRVTDHWPMWRPPDGSGVSEGGVAGVSQGSPWGGPSTAIDGGSLAEMPGPSSYRWIFGPFGPIMRPEPSYRRTRYQIYSGGILYAEPTGTAGRPAASGG